MRVLAEAKTDGSRYEEERIFQGDSLAETIMGYYLAREARRTKCLPPKIYSVLNMDTTEFRIQVKGYHSHDQATKYLDQIQDQVLEKLDPIICEVMGDIAATEAKQYCDQQRVFLENMIKRLDQRLAALEETCEKLNANQKDLHAENNAITKVISELAVNHDRLKERLGRIENAIAEDEVKNIGERVARSILARVSSGNAK